MHSPGRERQLAMPSLIGQLPRAGSLRLMPVCWHSQMTGKAPIEPQKTQRWTQKVSRPAADECAE